MTEDEKRLKFLQQDTYTCEDCGKDIVIEFLDDIHQDDSGDYHYQCWKDWADNEARYWSAQYTPNYFKLTVEEQLDAYEPGSAKRYAMERELVGN
jgi:hypothetical protein